MTRALLSLLAAVASLVTTGWILASAIPQAPLRRTNYRGVRVATGLGVVAIAGVMGGGATVAFIYSCRAHSLTLAGPVLNAVPILAAAGGFGMLGLWDDLSSAAGIGARGFSGHLGALRRGQVTGGALKLLAGTALAIAVAAPQATNPGWLIADGATIALTANLFNAFDLRPGRAAKMFLAGAIPLACLSADAGVIASAGAGAAVGFLPFDLRERAMLGDAGAYALGALLGAGIVYTAAPDWLRWGILGLLGVLTVAADRSSLHRLITRVPGLRALDRAGRVPEPSAPPGLN